MTFVFKIFAKNISLVKKNVHENVVYCKAVWCTPFGWNEGLGKVFLNILLGDYHQVFPKTVWIKK